MENLINLVDLFLIGFVGLIVSAFYSYYGRKREDEKFFRELFREFNSRYDALNDTLVEMEKNNVTYEELEAAKDEVMLNYRKKVIDFFNLCAEEYYWFSRGRIYDKIWNSWHTGMTYWYNEVDAIKRLWDEKESKEYISYYLSQEPSGFFPKDKKVTTANKNAKADESQNITHISSSK